MELTRLSGVGAVLGDQDGDVGVVVPYNLFCRRLAFSHVGRGKDFDRAYKAVEAIQAFAAVSLGFEAGAL